MSQGPSRLAPNRLPGWAATPYEHELIDGEVAVVRAGDIGTFIDFDGPYSDQVVVTFPAVGTFVFDAEAVDVMP